MAVFIERMADKEMVSIAVTGSLYKCHPTLKLLVSYYWHNFWSYRLK